VRIRVLHFALLREKTGTGEETLELPDGATAGEAAAALVARHPGIAAVRAGSRLAVNLAFAREDAVLHDGDELALIPPVSGG